eukprot:TRINITY_DN52069_c0_g1_i1.p2 TRINITY_DN52069_c0_g1~~TRINITY_DN52069_c0_g1_i1.p2  ORF type:complete len:197 (+),score=45.77 TRINITY_DN52069_c0_g1_i1:81-593(+)
MAAAAPPPEPQAAGDVWGRPVRREAEPAVRRAPHAASARPLVVSGGDEGSDSDGGERSRETQWQQVKCPACGGDAPVAANAVCEAAATRTQCPSCEADLLVDPHRAAREARNRRKWHGDPVCAYAPAPDFALSSEEFARHMAAARAAHYPRGAGAQQHAAASKAYAALGL